MNTTLSEEDLQRIVLILGNPSVFPAPEHIYRMLTDVVLTGEMTPRLSWELNMVCLRASTIANIPFTVTFLRALDDNPATRLDYFGSHFSWPKTNRDAFDQIARDNGLIP